MKNIGGLVKYNIGTMKNGYYYDADQIQTAKTEDKMVNNSTGTK